jgi:predicted GIY-YIG superfamily endonuclease
MLNFRPNYCINVHVAQSATIRGAIMVHEIEKFNQNMAYTALSRATSLDNIYINDTKDRTYTFEPFLYTNNRSEPDSPDLTQDIEGFIYHLVRNEKVFYVGQTDSLERRRKEHKLTISKDFSIVKVRTVLKGVDIDRQERLEIEKMIKAGAKLKNKQNLPKEQKVATIKEGVVKERTKLKGCIGVDERKCLVKFEYSVMGKRHKKEWKYKQCGLDVAMEKAKQFQKEMYA